MRLFLSRKPLVVNPVSDLIASIIQSIFCSLDLAASMNWIGSIVERGDVKPDLAVRSTTCIVLLILWI